MRGEEDEELLLEPKVERGGVRASLRRVGRRLAGGGSCSTSVTRLPVVSLYADDAGMRRKRTAQDTAPTRVVCLYEGVGENLSPASRARVTRLVRRLGPEALATVSAAAAASKENTRPIQPTQPSVYVRPPPLKRRRSLDTVLRDANSLPDLSDNKRHKSRGVESPDLPIPAVDIHLTALFAAVEHGHLEKARTILESTDVDVNGVNSDGLSPLDVAFLCSDRPLVKMLISFGAQEGNQFSNGESLVGHLKRLLREAEERKTELAGGEARSLTLWQRRAKGLANLILGYAQTKPPEAPSLVTVDVTGSQNVCVHYQEAEDEESPITTKYKIEWSVGADMPNLSGSMIVTDPRQLECCVDGLTRGQRYYFRVYCGNLKGWGPPSPVHSVLPSSWRDAAGLEDKSKDDCLSRLDGLFQELRTIRPDLKIDSAGVERRKKTTIRQLFTAASKFQKHLRRGVYLSCLLYHEDKVLVTNEDVLPVIEVDETYPSSIYNDIHWLLKVACSWDDVKWLKQDMEKCLSSSTIHFRIKLLQAAAQMQTALSMTDLGQLFHKVIRDSEGTVVVCIVNYVRSPKSISVLNSRWVPVSKLSKKSSNLAPDAPLEDILMASIPEQMTYHHVSSIKLPKGLYLCYLKMRSSVDLLQVLVPAKSPNILPHFRIRENPHVTAEEWEALTQWNGEGEPGEQQKSFISLVASATNRLLSYMQLPSEQTLSHRLYDAEVVEVSSDVSMLVLVPPAEAACAAPGQGELLQHPDLLSLPIQVFEMVHLGTYQKELVTKYCRLSCILDVDTALAQHSHREAFSSSEVTAAKEKLTLLEALQGRLNTAWKQARWLLDAVTFARDRGSSGCAPIRRLATLAPQSLSPAFHCGLGGALEAMKGSKIRGSWPGQGSGSHTRMLGPSVAEISRSEHFLTRSPSPPPQNLLSPTPLRGMLLVEAVLPPSRSEDTLIRTRSTSPTSLSPHLHLHPSPGERRQGRGSSQSVSSDESRTARSDNDSDTPVPQSGILQVYAAYETGLAAGTSLKLHVSARTTAREVVDLVVKQVNMAVVLRGKEGPIYPPDQLPNFCLVAVMGARERCLRDDSRPLALQNPWRKGRLYVRQKHDVLAALHQSARSTAFL